MKKLLGSTLALAMFAAYSQAANADTLLKNLTFNGKVDVQAVSANNVTDFNTAKYDQIGDAQTRVQLNAGWDLLDNVHAMASVVNNNSEYGNANHGGGSVLNTTNVQGQPLVGTTGLLGNTFLTQAYLKIDKLFGALDTTIGRQYYGNPGDLVVYYGPQDNIYGLAVNALDAFRFDWSNDMVGVTGVVGKTNATVNTIGNNSEVGATDLRGINVVAKGNEMYNGGVYVYNQVGHLSTAGNPPVANDNLWVAGLRGKYMMQGATLGAEFDKNFGEHRVVGVYPAETDTNYDGWALKVDLGYKADLAAASVSPWAEFTDLSGGKGYNNFFTPINTDYRPGGIYGLFAGYANAEAQLGGDNVGLGQIGNQVIWGIGVKTTPAALSKLTAGIAYWDYRYQTVAGETLQTLGNHGKGNTHIGSEIDLTGSWAESDNVSINGALGTFQPGGAIANLNAGPVRPAFLASTSVSVKF